MTVQVKGIGRRLKTFLCEEEGNAISEYAVMLALIVLATVAAIAVLGRQVASTTTSVSAGLPGVSEVQVEGPASTMQSHINTSMP